MNIQNAQVGSGGVTAQIKWSPEFIRNVENTLGSGGQLQQFVDATILESIEPYLPHDTGLLVASGKLNTVIGSGLIQWKTPYVRYLYHGLLMVDPTTGSSWARRGIKKVVTGTPLRFRGGGKRGSFWTERYKRDHLTELEKNVQLKAGELLRLG